MVRKENDMAREKLIYPPKVVDGNGGRKDYDCYLDAVKTKKVGDLVCAWAGAPGTGRHVQRITRIDATGVYGVTVENTIRELEPWEVE
jgi:hypothetical protein